MYKYKLFPILSLLICTLGSSQEAQTFDDFYAENDTIKKKKGEILKEVIISNKQQKTPSVVRSNIKPLDLPQSFQDVYKRQALRVVISSNFC